MRAIVRAVIRRNEDTHEFVTTSSWVTRRLVRLSRALLLPAPSRDTFLFRTTRNFKILCAGGAAKVRVAATRILQHLDLSDIDVDVAFRTGASFAGRVSRSNGGFLIEIDESFRGDAEAVGAILAHECCHILVRRRQLREFGNVQDEVHVDLAVMLSGLGALTLQGIRESQQIVGARIHYEHRSFGYLNSTLLFRAYADVASMLDLDIERATFDFDTGPGQPLRFALAWRRLARRIRWGRFAEPRLHASRAPSHVTRFCEGPSCEQRLRLPVGKVGSVTCPVCRHVRKFDATPLRVRVDAEATQVDPEPVPPRWLGFASSLPFAMKLLLLFMAAFPLVLLVREWR